MHRYRKVISGDMLLQTPAHASGEKIHLGRHAPLNTEIYVTNVFVSFVSLHDLSLSTLRKMNPLGVEGIQGVFDFLANTYFLHPADVVAMAGDDLMQLTFPGDGNNIDGTHMTKAQASAFLATARRIHQEQLDEQNRRHQSEEEEKIRQHQLDLARLASTTATGLTVNEQRDKAFKDGYDALQNPPNMLGFGHQGPKGDVVRKDAMTSSTFAEGYRGYKPNRARILDRMGANARSFAAAPPIDISGLPPWAQDALKDRFATDFSALQTNYVQGCLYANGGGHCWTEASVSHAIRKGSTHGLEPEKGAKPTDDKKRPRE